MDYKRVNQDFRNADVTVYGALKEAADRYPAEPAIGFFGKKTSFAALIEDVENTARALLQAGVRPGDAVTFMLPNCPQAVSVFYAISRVGATANMIHTLSAQPEITYYLDKAHSRFLVTLDSFCPKALAAAAAAKDPDVTVIVTSVAEGMPLPLKLGFRLKNLKNRTPLPDAPNVRLLGTLKKDGAGRALPDVAYDPDHTAAIFYSGGSTGMPKGIRLSDFNINSLGIQVADAAGHRICPGTKFLSAMPLFHGFGLGVGIHTFICNGATCVLVPQFTLDAYVKTLLKEKTNMLAIVPSMLEAFLHTDAFDGKDLSFLQGIFCGADAVPVSLQERVNAFLKAHGCAEKVREGFGMTEAVTACILNPIENIRPGSVGLPLGDTRVRIVKPGTFEDLPAGEPGEMLLSGSVVMQGYLDDPEANAKTLRKDGDVTWLFTGDMCYMDADGYVFFVQRLKRLIITNGYNVSPGQAEQIINAVPGVEACCVVGVKDRLSGQRVTAVIVPKAGEDQKALRRAVDAACRASLAAYAVPTKYEFAGELPLTKMGKIDFTRVERELNEKGEKKHAGRAESDLS